MQIAKERITSIIFDLGGVLLNIDYGRTRTAFEHLGAPNFSDLFSQAQQTELFSLFETGKITEIEFFHGVRTTAGIGCTDDEIRTAWNAMLLNFPPQRLEFLKNIKTRYKTYLLSNTNATHETAFLQIIQEENGIHSLNDYFNSVYFSHKIGYRKPDRDSFSYVLNENNLDANQTLFIDDSIQHVMGAKQLGIHSVHLDTSKENVIKKLSFLLA